MDSTTEPSSFSVAQAATLGGVETPVFGSCCLTSYAHLRVGRDRARDHGRNSLPTVLPNAPVASPPSRKTPSPPRRARFLTSPPPPRKASRSTARGSKAFAIPSRVAHRSRRSFNLLYCDMVINSYGYWREEARDPAGERGVLDRDGRCRTAPGDSYRALARAPRWGRLDACGVDLRLRAPLRRRVAIASGPAVVVATSFVGATGHWRDGHVRLRAAFVL